MGTMILGFLLFVVAYAMGTQVNESRMRKERDRWREYAELNGEGLLLYIEVLAQLQYFGVLTQEQNPDHYEMVTAFRKTTQDSLREQGWHIVHKCAQCQEFCPCGVKGAVADRPHACPPCTLMAEAADAFEPEDPEDADERWLPSWHGDRDSDEPGDEMVD